MKKLFFVGNAHLDPVWMWRWQEGSAEAKATIRSALDRMKEYPEFVFVCSSASVYKWIEDFAPDMFEEIRQRVREGRFRIVGGQFVQPDCNLPSGEGFARQYLYSQRYFHDRFGVTAEIGYNVDSFGHHVMTPQLLRKAGMRGYCFLRPGPHENALPSSVFLWQSPDGSTVPAFRIYDRYCFNVQNADELDTLLARFEDYMTQDAESGMFFYGVGNHGGGPTKRNIESVLASASRHPETEYVFSTVSDFFDQLDTSTLPVHKDDLQHHASGCYAAVSSVKHLIRTGENALLACESANMTAAHLTGKPAVTGELARAWENVLFSHFHDIAGGCSVKSAYEDTAYMLGESISIAQRLRNSAQQTVSWAIDTRDASRGLPIVVFNTLPFALRTPVVINRQVGHIVSPTGEDVAHQHVLSEARSTYGRSDTAFIADVPAMGYATYYIKQEPRAAPVESPLSITDNSMENENLRVVFDTHSGQLCSVYDKVAQRELLDGAGAIPTVIDEFGHDTWSHAKNFFTKEIATFADAHVRVLERGPVRVTMQVSSRYNDSTLTQSFSLCAGGTSLDVSAEIDWHEKHKMLKLAFRTALSDTFARYEIPFGVIDRPSDGEEEPGHRFFALFGAEGGVALLNSNKYSFSAKDNTMYLTVVRSPLYADHGGPRDDRSIFTDQGLHAFSYALMPADRNDTAALIRRARLLNTAPEVILENNHEGYLAANFSGISVDCPHVQVSAVKRAEDGRGQIVRLYETDGRDADACVSGPLLRCPLSVHVTPYSVNTYLLPDDRDEWREVLLTEFDMTHQEQ